MNPGIVNKLDPVRVFVGKADYAVDKDGQMEKDALAKMAAKIIIVVSKRCRPLHLLVQQTIFGTKQGDQTQKNAYGCSWLLGVASGFMIGGTISLTTPKLKNMEKGPISPH